MIELKRIADEAIPEALEKALRYRLLNEPHEAESICLDILEVQPANQHALATLLLALTDQFEQQLGMERDRALEVLPRLEAEYERAYYEGIVHERWGKAQLARGVPANSAAGWIRQAMQWFEKAHQLSPPGNPDAALRWNTCARFLQKLPESAPAAQSLTRDVHAAFGDDMPQR